jgi:putative FmdB family regulatory protein
MPLYEYECGACGHRFEIIQKFSDGPPDACRQCGKGPVQRLQSSPAFQFKGTGWYVTDYAGKGKSGEESGKGDAAKGDAKPAAKSEAGSSSGDSGGGESKKSDTPASTPAAKDS